MKSRAQTKVCECSILKYEMVSLILLFIIHTLTSYKLNFTCQVHCELIKQYIFTSITVRTYNVQCLCTYSLCTANG